MRDIWRWQSSAGKTIDICFVLLRCTLGLIVSWNSCDHAKCLLVNESRTAIMITCGIALIPTTAMSYQHYTPGASPYGYAGYPAYTYQPTGYQAQWYPYGYVPQQQLAQRPVANVPTASQPSSTPATPAAAPRQTTFTTTYTPTTYASQQSNSQSTPARGAKKQNNTRGLFTKECSYSCLLEYKEIVLITLCSAQLDVWIWG